MKYEGKPQQGLFGATLGFFIGFAAVALFGPTAKKFKDVMDLTPVMVGFLVAMPSLSGSLLRIPFSAWVDTTGGRKPFLVLLLLSILGMTGVTLVVWLWYPDGLTRSMYPLLLVLGLLSGSGIATFSVGISQVAYWFPKSRQGSALGTYAGIGNIAPGLFSLLMPVAFSALGLGTSYLVWLIFLIIGTFLYYRMGRNAWYFQLLQAGQKPEKARELALKQGQEIFPAGTMKASLGISAGYWKTWALVAIYFTTFGGFIALTSWLPTYWTSYFAYTPLVAGLLTALYSISTSLVRVGGGSISDRLGGERTLIAALLTMLAGAVLMSQSASSGLSIIATLLMAVGMGTGNAAVFKLVPQEVPQAVGGASGWVGGLGAFGGFALPPILGAFVRAQGASGYAGGFISYIVLAVFSIGLAFILRQSRAAVHHPEKAGAQSRGG